MYATRKRLRSQQCQITSHIWETGIRFPNGHELRKLEACWFNPADCLQSMVKGGWKQKETPVDEDEVDYRRT